MFERFTDRAQRVVVLAQEEARRLKHHYVGSEHILLGLIHDGEGVAATALQSLGVSLEVARHQVEEIIGQGRQASSEHMPFTPRVKKVLELSYREAMKLGHSYIGTGHLLLGLVREGDGVAAQTLAALGVDLPTVKRQVLQQLSAYAGDEEGTSTVERDEDLVDDELELPDEEVLEQAAFMLSANVAEEIRALLRDIAKRVERIERRLAESDDTP
jgi:ATP-dependent Clp protease ATP-binding subunit ClpC